MSDETAPRPTPGRGGRIAVLVATSVALVVVALAAYSTGRLSTLGAPASVPEPASVSAPVATSVEAGFARDMQVHHQQAVELAMIVRDATDDPDVRLLAYDIATTQGQQAGQLYGWLSAWELPQAGTEAAMAWMASPPSDDAVAGSGSGTGGHAGHSAHAGHAVAGAEGALMPGLATPAQVAELRALHGVEAERRFLELMIVHHQGAIEMADAALERTSTDVVVRFARSIAESQPAEIALMQRMLAERS